MFISSQVSPYESDKAAVQIKMDALKAKPSKEEEKERGRLRQPGKLLSSSKPPGPQPISPTVFKTLHSCCSLYP